MNTDKVKDLINNSDMTPTLKSISIGFIERANQKQQQHSEDRALIEQVANEKKLSEIILSNDEVKIYTVYGKDDWDINYPYRSIFLNSKSVWERTNMVSKNLDQAYLVYLEKKHLGNNSQFVDFAIKMLEINQP